MHCVMGACAQLTNAAKAFFPPAFLCVLSFLFKTGACFSAIGQLVRKVGNAFCFKSPSKMECFFLGRNSLKARVERPKS